MFDTNDLVKAIPIIEESLLGFLEIIRFDQDCFASPSSEESIIACRGTKTNFNEAASFWLLSLRADDWCDREAYFVPYAESGLCRPIEAGEYYSTIEMRCRTLKRELPAFLRQSRGLLNAQKMYDEWDDIAVIGEFNRCFVTFHWETTA